MSFILMLRNKKRLKANRDAPPSPRSSEQAAPPRESKFSCGFCLVFTGVITGILIIGFGVPTSETTEGKAKMGGVGAGIIVLIVGLVCFVQFGWPYLCRKKGEEEGEDHPLERKLSTQKGDYTAIAMETEDDCVQVVQEENSSTKEESSPKKEEQDGAVPDGDVPQETQQETTA